MSRYQPPSEREKALMDAQAALRNAQMALKSTLRALAESQTIRDTLQAENDKLRAAVDEHAAWEALGDRATTGTIVAHADSAYELAYVAIFSDSLRAEQYCEWANTTDLPEDATGEFAYPLRVMPLEVRITEAQIAFWNSTDDAPKEPAPTVEDVLEKTP